MTNMSCKNGDLALVDHYIVQTEQHLTEQACRIQQLTTNGRDTVQAEETFHGMEKTLSSIRAFREQILFDLLGQ
jgi:hypothetical protein